jgi:acyl-CoA thioesterase-2
MQPVAPGEIMRAWLRCGEKLGDAPGMQAAGLAYLSDFWTAWAALAPHFDGLAEGPPIYTATLSHSLWLHVPAQADDWLLMVQQSPRAANGRGLCFTRLYDQDGLLVATVAQEVLMARSPAG